MKYKCAMIQDLLPLYADNVASDESVEAIKQHVLECDECRMLYDNINSTDKKSGDTATIPTGDFLYLRKKIRKRRQITAIVIVVVLALVVGWFSDGLPKVIVKQMADCHLAQNGGDDELVFQFVEYSPAHDSYFAHYVDSDGDYRNIGVYYRWFPIDVYFDSEYPG